MEAGESATWRHERGPLQKTFDLFLLFLKELAVTKKFFGLAALSSALTCGSPRLARWPCTCASLACNPAIRSTDRVGREYHPR